MRTRTIYNAMQNAEREMKYLLSRYRAGPYKPTAIETRKGRQFVTFERELLRRMDERDALVAPRRVFLTPERIGQYMAGMSDDLKADNILGGKHEPD